MISLYSCYDFIPTVPRILYFEKSQFHQHAIQYTTSIYSHATFMNISPKEYGQGDATFVAAGGEEGVSQLVDTFYDVMETLPEARHIRAMHPDDLTLSRQKLSYFLCGWMGGPRLYMQHFGSINIPKVHMHLTIESEERDAWMLCMKTALDQLNYPESFKEYLMEQLFRPAEMIRQTSQNKTS